LGPAVRIRQVRTWSGGWSGGQALPLCLASISWLPQQGSPASRGPAKAWTVPSRRTSRRADVPESS